MSCLMSFTNCVIEVVTSPDLITKDLGTFSYTSSRQLRPTFELVTAYLRLARSWTFKMRPVLSSFTSHLVNFVEQMDVINTSTRRYRCSAVSCFQNYERCGGPFGHVIMIRTVTSLPSAGLKRVCISSCIISYHHVVSLVSPLVLLLVFVLRERCRLSQNPLEFVHLFSQSLDLPVCHRALGH